MDDLDQEESPPTLPERLQALLEMLFPEPPLVDILTLNSFTFSYRFTRLGPGAVSAIERAQRVTRSSGDYSQMGLSEFYAGLIYLHEGQFLGAAQYFTEARRYWTFDGSVTAVCLTHLAQGIAQQEAYHYEPALSRYSQAERCLRRVTADLTGDNRSFLAGCQALLADCRAELNRRMQAMDDRPDTDRSTRHVTLPPTESPATSEETSTVAESPPPPPPPPDLRPPANPPIVRIRSEPAPIQPVPASDAEQAEQTEPEISLSPVPGHRTADTHLVWYKVDPADDFDVRAWRADLSADASVLVDTRIERYIFQPGDLVVVNSEQAVGQIPVRPTLSLRQQFPLPIFLGEVEKPPQNGRGGLPDRVAGSVKLSPNTETPLYAEDIIGIVIGVWAGISLRPRPAK